MGLRSVRPDDRDFFFATREAAFRPYIEEIWGWDESDQRRRAAAEFDDPKLEIIEADGTPVGYLRVVHEADHDVLDVIALAPGAQRRGIGSQLIRDLMEAARARGVPIRLSVLFNNPARRLYERLGFRVTQVEHPRIKMHWPPPDRP